MSHGLSIKSKTTKNQFTNVDNLSIQKQHSFKMNISKLCLQVGLFTIILFTFEGNKPAK